MILCLTRRPSQVVYRKLVTHVVNTTPKRLLNLSCQVEQLKTRGLVRVSGNDASTLLQGIATNDMKHFQDNSKCIFTMFLNTKGRVLYDSIIYKQDSDDTFLIECDHSCIEELVKHLKMYKLRKKVQIDSVDDEFKVWVLFNPKELVNSNSKNLNVNQERIVPCSLPVLEGKVYNYLNDVILGNNITLNTDPRLSSLGSRVLALADEDVLQRVKDSGIQVEQDSPWTYRTFRYRLGVGEGIEELPIGKCFPLEVNCDYLHGVSFHKGCYIGQELTARTHHTGVVRKRLMPLVFNEEIKSSDLPFDTPIEDAAGQKKAAIGKLRGVEQNSGIGLMRIAEALEVVKLKVKSKDGETFRPFWWPQELPKERIDSGKSKTS